jgi:uncharacterized membrane protein
MTMADEQEAKNEGGGVEETVSKAKEVAGNGGGFASRLKSKEVLIPVAAAGATALAGLARRKGPDMAQKVKELGGGAAENLGQRGAEGAKQELGGGGGVSGLAGGVVSKALGGGGGHGRPKTRRLQIQRWTDVAVPIEKAFEAWMNFDEYPKFMHRVLSIKQEDNKLTWDEKIWFSKRQWEAEIVEQRDNELVAWKTTSGAAHAGVVSFHRLEDHLTRVMVTVDFRPTGMFEKMASGLRFVKRAVEADLARFKSYVEFQEVGLDAPQERLQDVKQEEDQDRDKGKDDGDRGQGEESDAERESTRSERQNRREQRREKATA